MIEQATLARPYAEAAFKRAKETQSTGVWSDMLAFLALVMKDQKISRIADNPKVERSAFSRLLLDICAGHLDDEGQNFAKMLVENDRLGLIHPISHVFESLRADDEGYVDVQVKTAYSLSQDDEEKLSKTLKNALRKDVRLHVEEDKSLIGGLLIRAGDQVIDASIQGQLQQLSNRLAS